MWHDFQPNAYGFVSLSMAEWSLAEANSPGYYGAAYDVTDHTR